MNKLGKQLSYLSIGLISLIIVFGVMSGRAWLEMFTIGGEFLVLFFYTLSITLNTDIRNTRSQSCCGGNPRRITGRRHGHVGTWCASYGKEKGDYEKAAICRDARRNHSDMCR